MAFALRPGKSIRRELKRIVRKELESASEALREYDITEDPVHQSRRSVKKVEAVARLLDQIDSAPPRRDVKRLRDARRALSTLRDADVMIEIFDRLRSRFGDRIPEHTAAIIRGHLMRQNSEAAETAETEGSLVRAAKTLQKIRRAAKDWPKSSIGLSELPGVLKRSFRASQSAMARAQTKRRAEDFHRWRKKVKNLWYQLRLAERLVAGLDTEIKEFNHLETALGEEHNLVVLRTKLTGDKDLRHLKNQLNNVVAMVNVLQEEIRRSTVVLGTRLHSASPKEFAKDLQRRLRPKGVRARKQAQSTQSHPAGAGTAA